MAVPDFYAPTIRDFDEATVLLRLSHNIHAIALNFATYRIKKSAARRERPVAMWAQIGQADSPFCRR